MTPTVPTTITVPASGPSREALLHERTEHLAEQARRAVAADSADAAECREFALMLGLIEVDPSGSLVEANPWDAETCDPVLGSLRE